MRKLNFKYMFALFLATAVWLPMAQPASAEVNWQMKERADEYGNMAMNFLQQGDVVKAAKLLNLALETNPYDNRWRMHYIKLMSKKGEASLNAGHNREAKVVFKVVETELLKAAKVFSLRGDDLNLSNCYAQIGDINNYVFRKRGIGSAYYRKALESNPQNAHALKALGRA